jgi:hypothetical protein
MLKDNNHLTHLELSWNPFGAAGGSVLAEHLQMNTCLLDCQLTGCGIADQTLLTMAHSLHRNRKGMGADLRAGPYQLFVEQGPAGGGPVSEYLQRVLAGDRQARGISINTEVSRDKTNELMVRLNEWRAGSSLRPEDSRQAEEMLGHLDGFQRQLEANVGDIGRVRERVDLLGKGFADREVRYRGDISMAQDKLLDYEKERKELQAIFSRLGDELELWRDRSDQEWEELQTTKRHAEGEDGANTNTLNVIRLETKEVSARLTELQERSAKQELENEELRKRVKRLRENVICSNP